MFYERFIALCKARGVTPTSVVKAIGISSANASFWKKGSIPSSKNLQKLAKFFEVPVDYLLGKSDSANTDITQDIIETTETESCKLFLTNLLREIDALPEQTKDIAIYEIATTVKLALRRYKRFSDYISAPNSN